MKTTVKRYFWNGVEFEESKDKDNPGDVVFYEDIKKYVYLKRVLYWVVFALLGVAFLLNISATTITFIKQKDHKMELQKKDVIIQALMVACEMDHLIKRIRGKE